MVEGRQQHAAQDDVPLVLSGSGDAAVVNQQEGFVTYVGS